MGRIPIGNNGGEDIMWEYWCKAIGTKAYDDKRKANHVAIIRTIWISLHVITCLMIIAGNSRTLGWI